MPPTLCYLIGAPGAGKSTLAAELTAGLTPVARQAGRQVQLTYHQRDGITEVVELGRRRPVFPGTDTLALSALPHVVHWLARQPNFERLLGEGDRLANRQVWLAARSHGFSVKVVRLVAPAEVLAARRQAQAGRGEQDASWLAGRATKAATLPAHLELDGTRPVAELAGAVRDLVGWPSWAAQVERKPESFPSRRAAPCQVPCLVTCRWCDA